MTLQELLDECRNNINSEVVFQEIVKEHDKQIRAEIVDKLFCSCGGGNDESDCELCTFAIFRDDIRIGCEILKLKENK